MNTSKTANKILVGFFPPFSNLAETGRAVMIAKKYRDLGGKAVFFSHGGKFEFLAKNNDFEIIKVKPELTNEQVEEWFKFQNFETFKLKTLLDENWLLENVKEEINAYKKTKIKLLVSTNNLTCAISARAAKIPYVSVTASGGNFHLKMPDALENPLTRLLPQKLKVKVVNFFFKRANWYIKPLNKVAEKVNAPTFKNWQEVFRGDYTFVTDYLEFINIFPNQQLYFSHEYVGMILLDELFENDISKEKAKEIDEQIEKHLKKPGKSIMVSLGSSGTKEIFQKILEALNQTEYNIIAIYSSILDEKNLPKLNKNIMLIKFVPSIKKVNSTVDLAIIHGGQGTVYNAIYSKKPIVGFPMHMEQQFNLEKIVGHGMGIMLSKRYFNENKLIDAINEIFDNYEYYQRNAEKLSKLLPEPKADENVAKIITKILTNKNVGD